MSTSNYYSARGPLRVADERCGCCRRARVRSRSNHPGSGRYRFAHCAAESRDHQPGHAGDGGRRGHARRDQDRRPREPAAAGFRRTECDGVQRRNRHRDGQPARPRLGAHSRADRRPPHAGRRCDLRILCRGPEPDPDRDGRARRSADRRRIRRVRFGRYRRRRELHHEEGLRRRADRWPVQPLSAQQRLRRSGRSEAARRDRRPRRDESVAVRAAR